MAIADIVKEADADETGFRSLFVTAPDGLCLHVRRYGERGRGLPIVCLPGLTRNGADFHEFATAMTRDTAHPRLVITIDSRGRGRSDHDPNPANYSFPVELADVIAVITALEIGPAIFLGTSRGGILTMLLGAARANRDRRRDRERHRSGDRREGLDAHQRVCRQAPDASIL